MPTALDDAMQAEVMSATVRRFADQSKDRSFVAPYEAGERVQVGANGLVAWDEARFSRQMAPISGPSSPTKAARAVGITKRYGRVLKISQHVDLPWLTVNAARGLGQLVSDPVSHLNNALLDVTNRILRTRNYWASKSLLLANGQVDPGSFPQADIPATSNVLTYPVQSLSAVVGWNLPATPIRSTEINPLKLAYRKATGFNPGVVIGSDTLDGYLNGNVEFNEFLRQGGAAGRQAESSYQEGNGVRYGGMDWFFAHDTYATDATPDTTVDIQADLDLCAVLPPQDMWHDSFMMAEGVQPVPTGAISSLGVPGATSLIAEVSGFGAYVELMMNPIGFRLHGFWCGLLVQKGVSHVAVFNTTP